MKTLYVIPKGRAVQPFSYVDDPGFHQNHEWRIVSSTHRPTLITVEDWCFTDDDVLPNNGIEKYVYVSLHEMFDEGNAFRVHKKDVESVIL